MGTLVISDKSKLWEDIAPILKSSHEVKFDSKSLKSIENSKKILESALKTDSVIYGVNTGFGKLNNVKIKSQDLAKLQLNLIRSHACGLGKPLDDGIVRVIMLLKLMTWSKGHSGVSIELANFLLEMLNNDILPVIPEKGSVGASGDLAPLAHLALSMIGEGKVTIRGEKIDSKRVFNKLGLDPVKLSAKEGISLINGTQVSTAIAIKAIHESNNLFYTSDVAAALSVEAGLCARDIFDPEVHKLKKNKNQLSTAHNIYNLLEGSEIVMSHINCNKVQDPYSIRCVPHVHGASKTLFQSSVEIVNEEINSVSDNPLIFNNGEIKNSGHFHAENISQAMDILSIAVSEIGAISEKRINYFMNGVEDKIPQFCALNPGLESGFMLAHVTTAALASENKTLSHPASVDSISTSAGMEDFVSMAPWSAKKCLKIINNVRSILAIELMVAANVNFRFHSNYNSSPHLSNLMKLFQEQDILTKKDVPFHEIIEVVISLIKNEKILQNIKKTLKLK